MIRFLADADFNHAIVKGCWRHEPAMDFLSANEAKLEGVPDPDVLALAAEQDRVPRNVNFLAPLPAATGQRRLN
jgi:hypothetical protein